MKTIRYFIKTDGRIEQLIYKKYKTKSEKIATNYGFRSQLWEALQCGDFNMDDLAKIEYKDKSLIQAFRSYIECSEGDFVFVQPISNFKNSHVSIKDGARFATLYIQAAGGLAGAIYLDTNFKPRSSFSIGFELEHILRFNNRKWSILAEPTFQSYKTTEYREFKKVLRKPSNIIIKYQSVEIPIGIRYTHTLGKKIRLYSNAHLVFDLPVNSNIKFEEHLNYLDDKLNTSMNVNLGIGLKYNNKFLIELRAGTNRELLLNYFNFNIEYRTFGLYVGYIIL